MKFDAVAVADAYMRRDEVKTMMTTTWLRHFAFVAGNDEWEKRCSRRSETMGLVVAVVVVVAVDVILV